MSKPIHQIVIFNASPHEVYEALMDSKKHDACTGGKTRINREAGSGMIAYHEYICGKKFEPVPDKSIVHLCLSCSVRARMGQCRCTCTCGTGAGKQAWRAVDWPEGFFSRVTFELSADGQGTRLDFTHAGLPEGTAQEFARGWIDNYWEPMNAWFEKEAGRS